MVDITILVLNFNNKEVLKLQLPILTSLKGVSYELIVIDNNSTDGSKEYVRESFPDLKMIEVDRNTGTDGFNHAISHVSGEYILWIGDMIIHEESLLKLKQTLDQNSGIGIAVPYLINYFSKKEEFKGELISRTMYSKTTEDEMKEPTREIVGTGVGLIGTDTLKEIGNKIYDPDYFLYGEDIDLGIRVRLRGKRSVIVKGAKMYHAHLPITVRTFSRRYLKFLTERNLTLTFLRTFKIGRTIVYLPYYLLTRILGLGRDIVGRDWPSFVGRIQGMFWPMFHPIYTLKKRKITQSLRKVSDKYVLKLFSEKAIFSKH